MSIPNFTAQASLYKSSRHYRGAAPSPDGSPPGGLIVPAYFPGSATEADCQTCVGDCTDAYNTATAIAAAGTVAGCLTLFGCPAAVAAGAAAQAGADEVLAACLAKCDFPGMPDIPIWPKGGRCCPKLCGFWNPLDPGSGCCDRDEHCVDMNDPNSRNGCCPSDQNVCGGSCCAKGNFCCGDSCCPIGQPCTEGSCGVYPPLFPPGTQPAPPPPPPPPGGCPPGTWYNPSFGCAPIIH
jgi:hypothetical protein